MRCAAFSASLAVDAAVTPETSTDPLLYSHPLPIVKTFYPSGFGLELATDSVAMAEIASGIWGRYPKLFDVPPVRLRIAVSTGQGEMPPRPSMPRGQENLVSIIHGPDNFAVADLARGFAFAGLTLDVVRSPAYTAHYFLEPLAYLLLAARHVTILHAACIALNGRAVLLAGDSGSGKTCLSYACARRGWTFLSGDATQFAGRSGDSTVIGRPFKIRFREEARELFPELGVYPAKPGFNGKTDIEPPVEDLNIPTAVQANAAHIVFLHRSPEGCSASLSPVSSEEAFRRMAPVISFGDDQLRAEQRAALARFIGSRPASDLKYSDLSEAECVLRSLLDGAE